jgi:hypothetical protein
MGFWPFGKDSANVEMVSRVITGATQNGYRLRGKLTLHFWEPQRQAEADQAAERCVALALALIKEAQDHQKLIGAEVQLSAELLGRYIGDPVRARAVELAALHVVGDPALSDELRRASSQSGSMAAVAPPASSESPAPKSTPPPPPVSKQRSSVPPQRASAPPGVTPLAPAVSSALPRRRGSSQIRSIQSLLMPPGTPPAAMGQFVAPTVKDAAARLLIGFLRAHDLVGVRGVALDEGSREMLATLVPASDAPPGGYEASRASEIARWQATLGQGPMATLRREVRRTSLTLAREALGRAQVMQALTDAVMEALASAAFPDDAGLLADVARKASPADGEQVPQLARDLIEAAGTSEDPGAMAAALGPLLAAVQDDLNVSALIIKQSSGA